MLVISSCITPQSRAFKINCLIHFSSTFKTSKKKNKNLPDLKISANSADWLYTANPRNVWKVKKLVLLAHKRLDYY